MFSKTIVNSKVQSQQYKYTIELYENKDKLDIPLSLVLLGLSSQNSQEIKKILFEKEQKEYFSTKELQRLKSSKEQNQQQIYKEMKQKDFLQILTETKSKMHINPKIKKMARKKLKTCILTDELRQQIWLIQSNSYYYIQELYFQYYDNITKFDYPDFYLGAIENDIRRTFFNIEQRMSEDSMGKMRNILKAFSRRNPQIGYCQGMNFIVSFLMQQNFQEEQCFWILCHVIESIMPIDYYSTMLGALIDQQIFQDILMAKQPDIAEKFIDLGLDLAIFTINWFVCIFSNTLQYSILKIVWDYLFTEGSIIIFKVGLVILEECYQTIMQAQEFSDIIIKVDQVSKQINNPLQFSKRLDKIYLNKNLVNRARQLYRKQLETKILASSKLKRPTIIKCSALWPVCHHFLDISKQVKDQNDFFVFKIEKFEFIQNYFDEQKIKKRQSFQLQPSLKNFMIGRSFHICDKQLNDSISTQQNVSYTSEEEKSDEYRDQMDSLNKSQDILAKLDENSEIHRQLERTSSVQFLKSLSRVNTAQINNSLIRESSKQLLHKIQKLERNQQSKSHSTLLRI